MFPNKSKLHIALCLFFALATSSHSLPTDAQLDSLVFAAINYDLSNQGAKRDEAESKLEAAAQARLQADSAKNSAQKRLDQLQRSRVSRQQELERDLTRLRQVMTTGKAANMLGEIFELQKRFPGNQELIEMARVANAARIRAANTAPNPVLPTDSARPAPVQPVCQEAPQLDWLDPKPPEVRTGSDSLLRLRIRINTPCGMARLALFVNQKEFRLYPVGKSGLYELEDVLTVDSAGSLLHFEVCDTKQTCVKSASVMARRALPLPAWIMWLAIGVLGAGIGLAAFLFFARSRATAVQPISSLPLSTPTTPETFPVVQLPIETLAAPEPAPVSDLPPPPVAVQEEAPQSTGALATADTTTPAHVVENPEIASTAPESADSDTKTLPRSSALISSDLQETQAFSRQEILGNQAPAVPKLAPRDMLQAVVEKAQAMESGEFPRFLFRIPPGIGSLALDPTHIEAPLVEFLRLCMRRAKAKGLVLIALGQGPVNLEIVLEDSGPEPQPETVRLLLDWKEPIRPERLGLDKELYQAHTLVQRAAGSATVECRIDGGLRLRLRLPFYRTPNQSGVAV